MSEDQFSRPLSVAQQRVPVSPDGLYEQFPTVLPDVVLAALIEANRSVELFGLSPQERGPMVRKIAEEQLKQLTGESSGSMARLDPEVHRRRVSARNDDSLVDQD